MWKKAFSSELVKNYFVVGPKESNQEMDAKDK